MLYVIELSIPFLIKVLVLSLFLILKVFFIELSIGGFCIFSTAGFCCSLALSGRRLAEFLVSEFGVT
jgi:hypothetical protein